MRWIDHVMNRHTDLYFGNSRVLHIAPEEVMEKKIRRCRHKNEYISGDICPGLADHIVDVTRMGFADGSFDWIILNHVLEHVKDEKAALSEIARCLAAGGHFFFSMPVSLSRDTYERNGKMTAEQRLIEYGQADHYRVYGKDMVRHIETYGFKVKEYKVQDYLSDKEISRLRLMKKDRLYIGEKVADYKKNNG